MVQVIAIIAIPGDRAIPLYPIKPYDKARM